jgi:hypothetical protein
MSPFAVFAAFVLALIVLTWLLIYCLRKPW